MGVSKSENRSKREGPDSGFPTRPLRTTNCRLQIPPPTRSEVGAIGGRAVSDDFGKAASAMGVLRCAQVLRRASREDARHADSPQRDESVFRCQAPPRDAPSGSAVGRWRVEVSEPKRTRGPTAVAPDHCRCLLFAAAVADRCRCLSGPGTRLPLGLRRGKWRRAPRHPHLTLYRMNQTFNVRRQYSGVSTFNVQRATFNAFVVRPSRLHIRPGTRNKALGPPDQRCSVHDPIPESRVPSREITLPEFLCLGPCFFLTTKGDFDDT